MSTEVRAGCPARYLLGEVARGLYRPLPSGTAGPYNRAAEGILKTQFKKFHLRPCP